MLDLPQRRAAPAEEPGRHRLEDMSGQAADCAAPDVLAAAVEALSVREAPEASDGSAEGGSTPSGWASGACALHATPSRLLNAAAPPAIYLAWQDAAPQTSRSGPFQHLCTAAAGNCAHRLQAKGGQPREGEPAGEPYALRARPTCSGGCQCESAWQEGCLSPHR